MLICFLGGGDEEVRESVERKGSVVKKGIVERGSENGRKGIVKRKGSENGRKRRREERNVKYTSRLECKIHKGGRKVYFHVIYSSMQVL